MKSNCKSVIGVIDKKHCLNGTYIQKHHRHVVYWVNTPPSGGPPHVAKMNTLITIPIYKGRLSNSTTWLIMLSAPCRMPAAPRPATARPAMNMLEETAVAQRMVPAI